MKNITFVLMMLVAFVANAADPEPVPVDGVFSNPVHSCNVYEPTFDFDVNIENNNFSIYPHTGSVRFRCYIAIDNNLIFSSVGMQIHSIPKPPYSSFDAAPNCRYVADYNQPYVDTRANDVVTMEKRRSVSYGNYDHVEVDNPRVGAKIRSVVLDCSVSAIAAERLTVFGVYISYL
ncbi:hypothetical protein [Sessilibacter corallicola]|uniref:hypothetical protein n=1 Tax=Sessilibacter corallicola TaxID=2904075 RepID=UPI001E2A8A20|nr:hypothetical protein [Sessilibacter corallicola]MCE2027581.1 hypothetical protein [Sessilibacter corallicola]